MAFVNERIPEADKVRFNSFGFINPVTGDCVEPWKWTIDRERDIFLVGLGGQGYEHSEIPMFYALVLGKRVISIETFSWGKGDACVGVEKWWKLTSIKVPQSLFPEKDKIIELIKEAFDAHGSGYKRDHVKKINFEYIASPVFVSEV